MSSRNDFLHNVSAQVVAGVLLLGIAALIAVMAHSCSQGGGGATSAPGTATPGPAAPSTTAAASSGPPRSPEPSTAGTAEASSGGTAASPLVAVEHAAWSVSDCRLSRADGVPVLHATVYVKNKDPNTAHSCTTTVVFGPDSDRLAADTIYVDEVKPLQTGKNEVVDTNPSPSVVSVPDGPVSCRITGISDYDTGASVQE
ncbi:hypothetical protein GCM10018781_11990 [Kitasatospora indigofera]|uniref:Uncharacterized protein n=1 Tax=Kitasatospora indigofera TaxID=67307 RepID=A0A919FEE1_9ACTN|nr:hypothetical protein [Kitasatospora indigofera]GHH63096.1 hypothetical protein GCM10018781_11990 [Kitasatospora indigofera]